jgi:hypothetical protein
MISIALAGKLTTPVSQLTSTIDDRYDSTTEHFIE